MRHFLVDIFERTAYLRKFDFLITSESENIAERRLNVVCRKKQVHVFFAKQGFLNILSLEVKMKWIVFDRVMSLHFTTCGSATKATEEIKSIREDLIVKQESNTSKWNITVCVSVCLSVCLFVCESCCLCVCPWVSFSLILVISSKSVLSPTEQSLSTEKQARKLTTKSHLIQLTMKYQLTEFML